ncbi:MAG: hypothetical protein AB9835_13035 [Eubacteriales bacterium]
MKYIPIICILVGLALLLTLSHAPAIPPDVAFYETAHAMFWERDGCRITLKQMDLMKLAHLIIEGTISEVHHYTLAYNYSDDRNGIKTINYYTVYTVDIDEIIANRDNYKEDTVKIMTMHLGKPELNGEYLMREGRSYIIIVANPIIVSYSRPELNKLLDSPYGTGTGQMVFPVRDDGTVTATRAVLFNSTKHESAPEDTILYKDGGVPIIEQNENDAEIFKVSKEPFINHLKKLYEAYGNLNN